MELDRKAFDAPVVLRLGGDETYVADTVAARDLLMSAGWPGERGGAHKQALDACLKVLDGHRSTVDAREAFVAAAREADILSRS